MNMALTRNRRGRTGDVTASATGSEPTGASLVHARFQRSPYLPLRNINCSLRDGVLLLRGRVPTYYLKQMAQTIGTSAEGVREVVNELGVDFPERGQGSAKK